MKKALGNDDMRRSIEFVVDISFDCPFCGEANYIESDEEGMTRSSHTCDCGALIEYSLWVDVTGNATVTKMEENEVVVGPNQINLFTGKTVEDERPQ